MSEVTTMSSLKQPEGYSDRAARQASPDSSRQAAKEGGNVLPPSVSLEPRRERPASATDVASRIKEAVAQMNEYIQSTQRDLRFSIDEASGETIVKVLDRQTEEVIRQIPDEVFLKLARSLDANEPVHFFSEQA